MLKYVGVKCLDTLELPCEDRKGWKKSTTIPDAKKVSVFATDNNIFVTHTGGLVIQHLIKNPTLDHTDTDCNIQTIVDHKSMITCIGFSQEGSLVCTCSDEAVILRKRDLNQWDSYTIGECLGRIQSCTIAVYDKAVYIFLAKQEEIIVLQATSSYSMVESGPLDVLTLEMFLTLKKARENLTWLKSAILNDTIYIVGLSSGNGISLKMWQFSPDEKKLKIMSQQTALSSMKSVVSADMKHYEDNCYLLLIDSTGYVEIYNITFYGFCLLNRLKVDDNSCKTAHNETYHNRTNSTMNQDDIGHVQVEFRVLSAQFFFKDPQKPATVLSNEYLNESSGDGLPLLNNSLSIPSFEGSSKFSKLSFIVAVSNKILFVDGKSGESHTLIEYEEFVKSNNIMVNNAKLAINSEYGEILIAIQPMLQKHIFTFRLCVEMYENEDLEERSVICSLVPTDALDGKSVLRKRLKSPPKPALPGRKQSLMQIDNKLYPNWIAGARKNVTHAVAARASSSFTNPKDISRKNNGPFRNNRKAWVGAGPYDIPMTSSRSIKIVPKGSYSVKDFDFSERSWQSLPSSLSEDLSSVRMATTRDGKVLAVGGNKSPLTVTKALPTYEQIRSFKDITHLTSVSFSFNAKHLLLSTNDGKSIVFDWQTGKELIHLQFASKFNEHIHSQFYFMDKFILQPEERQIVLYSYAVRDSGSVKAKAGSFGLRCQNITAVSAANQFLSNIIITGQSNKCLEVFDANVEQVVANVPNCHVKPVNCIRLNEAPKGNCANELCNFVMTTCPSYLDPIKIWDLRTARCIIRLSDLNGKGYIPTARPSLSPCGRYIASGLEENCITLYDVRKINSRVCILRDLPSAVMDCVFDPNFPMLWCACKNGTMWHFNF